MFGFCDDSQLLDVGAAIGRVLPLVLATAALALFVYCLELPYRLSYVQAAVALCTVVSIAATLRMSRRAGRR